jgi:ribosomal protein S12 methylthiotransferase accessory factor
MVDLRLGVSHSRRVDQLRIALIGLDSGGPVLVDLIRHLGVAAVVAYDRVPPFERGLAFTRATGESAAGSQSTSEITSTADQGYLRTDAGLPTFGLSGCRKIARSSDLVIAATSDPQVHKWVDKVAREARVSALHGQVGDGSAWIGPTTLPTSPRPCHRCWQLRRQASQRSTLGVPPVDDDANGGRVNTVLGHYLASIIGQELLAVAADPDTCHFVAAVQEYPGRGADTLLHHVIAEPMCDICGPWVRTPPSRTPSYPLAETGHDREPDFGTIERFIVDDIGGLVTILDHVPKPTGEPELPIVSRAVVADVGLSAADRGRLDCSGKGWSWTEARDTALAEAVERYCGLTWQPHTVLNGVASAMPYRTIASGSNDVEAWAAGWSLATHEQVAVPMRLVTLNSSHSGLHDHRGTSANGLAAGRGLRDAVLRGLAETVERDAFMRAWLGRAAPERYRGLAAPDPFVSRLARQYERVGISLDIYHLQNDTRMTTFAAVLRGSSNPARAVGLGVAADVGTALRRAVAEVAQARLALISLLQTEAGRVRARWLVDHPSEAESRSDHGLLYAMPESAKAFSSIERAGYAQWPIKARKSAALPTHELGSVVQDLIRAGVEPVFVDVTTPDVVDFDLAVARAIVPGYLAPDFGPKIDEKPTTGRGEQGYPHPLL